MKIIPCLLLALAFALSASAQSSTPLVPAKFVVPEKLETSEFRLRVLTVHDVVKDYEAVMTSVPHLKTIFPGSAWPDGLTLEQNLTDLGWHQKEFQSRRSFAYTVVTLDETRVIGCVYINPTRKRGYDASVSLWARASELPSGLEDRLYLCRRPRVDRERLAIQAARVSRPQHSAQRLAGTPG